MKVQALKTWEQLKEAFVEGDILELTTKVTQEDEFKDFYGKDPKNPLGKLIVVRQELIRPKGSYIDYIVTNSKGDQYSGTSIANRVGYRNSEINKLFKKL